MEQEFQTAKEFERSAGLPRDSVVNISQLLTLHRSFLTEHATTLTPPLQRFVDAGLRTVLQL
jgi:mRNA interferase MazF